MDIEKARQMGETLRGDKRIVLARAYVAGLERDRLLYQAAQERNIQTTWENIQLAALNRGLQRVLSALVVAYDSGTLAAELINQAEDLLAANDPLSKAVWDCPCGHSKYDHDENGCMYLGCKPICGHSVHPIPPEDK